MLQEWLTFKIVFQCYLNKLRVQKFNSYFNILIYHFFSNKNASSEIIRIPFFFLLYFMKYAILGIYYVCSHRVANGDEQARKALPIHLYTHNLVHMHILTVYTVHTDTTKREWILIRNYTTIWVLEMVSTVFIHCFVWISSSSLILMKITMASEWENERERDRKRESHRVKR